MASSAHRTGSRTASSSRRPTALDQDQILGSRPPYSLGLTQPTTGLSTRTDPGIFLGMGPRPPRAAATLATERLTTRSSSPTSTRRTSTDSTLSAPSTAATSVSSGPPPPALSTAEKNRQKQQRYRDRIKDTISTLQTANTRLTAENLALLQRVVDLEERNAALERPAVGSLGPPAWMSSGFNDGLPSEDEDARSWASSDVESSGMQEDTTPVPAPAIHPLNQTYSSFTPPTSVGECPPAPRLGSLPDFAPDAAFTPPAFPGLLADAQRTTTALGHYLFRTAETKSTFSGGPSPIFPVVGSKAVDGPGAAVAGAHPAVLGSTPSNVLGLQFDSPASAAADPFSVFALQQPLVDGVVTAKEGDALMDGGWAAEADKENRAAWSTRADSGCWAFLH